jgi:pyruvate-formate lyase-activating enzyme
VDMVVLDLKTPFDEALFERTTKSRTFFKPTESIITDIRNTLEQLRENSMKVKIITTVVPGLMFRKEDILKLAKIADDLNASFILQQFDNAICYDTRYMSIKPASYDFLQNLKELAREQFPTLHIEINANSAF